MKKTAKQKQSQAFMCLLLASILLFVSSVCLYISRRNKRIAEFSKTETSSAAAEQKTSAVTVPGKNAESEKAEPVSSTAENTSETAAETAEPTTKQPEARQGTPEIITIDESDWYLTLINTNYRIPDDYTPSLSYVCSSGEQLDSKVAPHYEKMYKAALEDGVTLTPCSGYRSYSLQERNYNNKTAYYESLGYTHSQALAEAATIIMPPGSSEHNLGYAMDIVCVEEWFEDTAEFKWLNEHAADYGFILRYPADKTDITKVTYEPWHWRYVGVEDAKAIKASGQVLEEYLASK